MVLGARHGTSPDPTAGLGAVPLPRHSSGRARATGSPGGAARTGHGQGNRGHRPGRPRRGRDGRYGRGRQRRPLRIDDRARPVPGRGCRPRVLSGRVAHHLPGREDARAHFRAGAYLPAAWRRRRSDAGLDRPAVRRLRAATARAHGLLHHEGADRARRFCHADRHPRHRARRRAGLSLEHLRREDGPIDARLLPAIRHRRTSRASRFTAALPKHQARSSGATRAAA